MQLGSHCFFSPFVLPYRSKYKFNHSFWYSERQTTFSSEDEVEFPVFHNDVGFISSPRVASLCNPEEEIISDNEEKSSHRTLSITSGDQNHQEAHLCSLETEKEACTWSAINKEAEVLSHIAENARCSSSWEQKGRQI